MEEVTEIRRRRVLRVLSEVKHKLEEALRLSRRRDAGSVKLVPEKQPH